MMVSRTTERTVVVMSGGVIPDREWGKPLTVAEANAYAHAILDVVDRLHQEGYEADAYEDDTSGTSKMFLYPSSVTATLIWTKDGV